MAHTITRRDDGRYMERVYLGNVNGKTKYKTVYGKSPKEVSEKADTIRIQLRRGVNSDNPTFEQFMNQYLTIITPQKSESSIRLIISRLNIFNSFLSNIKLKSLKQNDIQNVINQITQCNPYTGKPASEKTIKDYIQYIRAMLENAVDNGYIEKNPTKRLVVPKTAKESRERRALTEREREYIMNFQHRGQLPMMLMMLSGLRKGEATALQWSDIDLKNKTITVSKSYDFKAQALKSPKNGKSRIVTIPDKLVDFLSKQPNQVGFAIISAHDKMMTETAWKRLLESYLTDLNCHIQEINKFNPHTKEWVIEPFTYHCLRHTFCTLMYEAGVDVLTAQQQMGHSSPEITMKIYTHLSSSTKQNSIKKLNDFLK